MDDSSSSGRGSNSQKSTARSDGYFDNVHKVIERHVQKGNGDALLLLLSLPELHEDALFWRSCKNHAGIASAVLSNYLAVTGETQNDDSAASRVPLSRNELYGLLKRCGDDQSACSAVINAMEEGQPVTVDLANLCSLLQARAVPAVAKGDREGNPLEENEPTPTRGSVSGAVSSQQQRLLEALTKSALPGTIATADSFDDIGQFNAPARPARVSGGVVPLQQQQNQKPPSAPSAPSRVKQQFSKEEDEAIVRGIAKFAVGPSRFTDIYLAYKEVWKDGRTALQIADHWRSVLKDKTIRASTTTTTTTTKGE